MADTNTQAPPQQHSVTELVGGILEDAQKLLKQHVDMLRAEIREDLRNAKQAAQLLGFGAILAALGGLLLAISCVYGLSALFPDLPFWACWAMVGGTFLLPGVVILLAGERILAVLNPLPEKSYQSLEEDFKWLTKTQLPK